MSQQKQDLPERLRALAESLVGDEWNHPITARQDVLDAAEELEAMRDLNIAQKRIDKLQGIVDRLPKTVDGVPLLPGTEYWRWQQEGRRYVLRRHVLQRDWYAKYGHRQCYSTREAAQAAKGGYAGSAMRQMD